jgi:Asp-tRNA(Asn)/Glu-tRNA(Gln) amidotransferase A subunit family amidase
LSVSVKDLFDVAGQPTTGGSKALFDAPPAAEDSRVVARLRRAGAALIGQTNLSEFAFSGVGINPHHGTPANAGTLTVDAVARIPGGSTSGGAVSVACGAAWAALGSDTGGSIRIPAALQGLVGFKPTQRLVPLEGSIPLSTTLDTACAVTLSVRDAVTLHAILSGSKVELTRRPIESLRLAVPTTLMLEGLEPSVARNFERALKLLSHAGARIETIQLPELTELAAINSQGDSRPPNRGPGIAEGWPSAATTTTPEWHCAFDAASRCRRRTTSICYAPAASGSLAFRQRCGASTRHCLPRCHSPHHPWHHCYATMRPSLPSMPGCCATPRR